MLRYAPGGTLAHRLDPRTVLAIQVTFALAAYAHTTPLGLAVLTALTVGGLGVSRTAPIAAIRSLRVPLTLLTVAPLIAGVTLGPPWFSPTEARGPALASYRVALILMVTAAAVRTTSVRETRAAVQWLVPGRPGQFLGVGIGIVARFLPVLRDDLRRAREANAARLGTERPLAERIRTVAVAGLTRSFTRADRVAVALKSRCFAWNPTLPALGFGRVDLIGWAIAIGLVGSLFV